MQVLFVTSEVFPLIKTGGLADVSSALPKALKALDAFNGDVKILLPGYLEVLSKLVSPKKIATVNVLNQSCDLLLGKLPSSTEAKKVDAQLDVLVIANPDLYEREGGPYTDENGEDWPDNALRFGVLSRLASLLCGDSTPLQDWRPDIVHCNDWQTGLVPAYLKLIEQSSVKSVFSIHNLAFQGCFDSSSIDMLGLPLAHFRIEGYEYYGQLSFLKAGLYYADKLTTVSPTYAQEIQTATFGFGMQGLLASRSTDLIGILNGIDTQIWNPETDEYLYQNYSARRIAGKKKVKQRLQKKLMLSSKSDSPLLGVVSRFAHQKGLDLLPKIIPKLVNAGCQFAILGSGDKNIEAKFLALAREYPTEVSVSIQYNEPLSHNIMAGSDMFIMPSRFEPCGLNQMYGMAYGTPPIVTSTGGLADSVVDTSTSTLQANTATGFVIDSPSDTALLSGIQRAIDSYNKPIWRKIQRNGMTLDLSWESRARVYFLLYQRLLGVH